MRFPSPVFLAVAFLFVGVALLPATAAQSPPASIQRPPTDYFPLGDGSLTSNATAGTVAPCVGFGAGTTLTNARTFTTGHFVHTDPGNFYPLGQAISVKLDFVPPNPNAPQAHSDGGGFTVRAIVGWGGQTTQASQTFAAAPTATQEVTLSLPIDAGNLTPSNGDFTLRVELSATNAQATPQQAVGCGSGDTKVEQIAFGLGILGDGDIDGDGIPDSEDDDRDGDGVDNALEAAFVCTFTDTGGNQTINFADNPQLMPGDNDADGDGFTDEAECAAGVNPLSSTSTIPQPAGFPWALVILLILVLAIGGGIVFVVLKFGRIISVAPASVGQVIVDPGKAAKYEMVLENKRSSGEALTVQLATEGMPEGWDAKVDVDHVSLEPAGSGGSKKTVFVSVEAPEHPDPESAVVVLKVIPLNKQGRKDTFKLAGKAQTITSINVPPDAKVPVKRGGPVKLKSGDEKDEVPETAVPPDGVPVTELADIKPAQAKKLAAAGAEKTEALRVADASELAKKTKLGEADIIKWQQMSDLIRIPGVSMETAKALVAAGYPGVKHLAEADPDEVAAEFNKQVPAAPAEEATIEVS